MQSHQVGEHRAKTRPAPERPSTSSVLSRQGRPGLLSSSCVPRVKDLEGTGEGQSQPVSRASVERSGQAPRPRAKLDVLERLRAQEGSVDFDGET